MFKNKIERAKFVLTDIFDFGKIVTPISIQREYVGEYFLEPFEETRCSYTVRIFGLRIIVIQWPNQ